jgi:hypothetical protein
MDRGGPARVDRLQYGDQCATPPPTSSTRGDGQACGPTAPPSVTHARGGRRGLTATDLSRHALSLYRQCVAAGQWASISVENRPDGQHIAFASRPMAAAPAAACAAADGVRRRRPNQRRKEKKQLWLRSRQQQQQQAEMVAAAKSGSYAQVAARAANCSAASAAAPAVPAAATVAVAAPSCSPVSSPSPMLTRARKRKKRNSPGAASVAVQLDGAEQTPPSSPLELSPRLAAAPPPGGPQKPASQPSLEGPPVSELPLAHTVQPVPDEPASPVSGPALYVPDEPLAPGERPANWWSLNFTQKMDILHAEAHLTKHDGCRRCEIVFK